MRSAEAELDPLEERSVIEAADGSVLAEVHGDIDREIVSLDDVPRHVRTAVLAAEDQRFYEHEGYDLAGILRALVANLRAGGVSQGGSTITQQLAKQNFVGSEQSLSRKVAEVVHAVALEEELGKDELLERYLNEVYFGSGAYGIETAAAEFFDSTTSELDVHEAAMLAGVIRAPSSLEPRENPSGAEARRDQVLHAMAAGGLLDESEARELAARPLEIAPPRESATTEPFAVEAVKRAFLESEAFGDTREDREHLLYTGGVRIRTNLDPELQQHAREAVDGRDAEEGPTGALVALDPRDGRVRAMYADADFSETQFDVITQGRRQPGSALKPFLFASALESGIPREIELEGESGSVFEDVRGWDSDGDGVRNFGERDHGRVALTDALVSSVNTAFAELVLLLGTDPFVDLLHRTGIDIDAALGPEPGPAISLGGLQRGVTPLELAGAYGVLATGGQHVAPRVIERVDDRDGQPIHEARAEPEVRVHPAAAAATTEAMQDVVRHGTGTGAQISGWEPAGKTGTTQNSADAWFVGSVPTLTTAVWLGHPEGQVPMPGVTGGSVPAPVWAEFMTAALEDEDPADFPEADASLDDLADDVTVPDVRGESEESAREMLLDSLLVVETVSEDNAAPRGTVLWQSPRAGTGARAGDSVTLGISTGTPPPPPEPDPEPEPEEPEPEPEEPEPDPEPEPEEPDEPEEGSSADDPEGESPDTESEPTEESPDAAEGDATAEDSDEADEADEADGQSGGARDDEAPDDGEGAQDEGTPEEEGDDDTDDPGKGSTGREDSEG